MAKDKVVRLRVDEEFKNKLEYIKTINSYKSVAETIRKVVEKEYKKETMK